MKKILALGLVAISMVLGQPAMADDSKKITACVTGGGFYEKVIGVVSNRLKAEGYDVVISNDSTGSPDSLERFSGKECNLTIVQGDAMSLYGASVPLDSVTVQAHTEAVMWITNVDAKYKNLDAVEDMEDAVLVVPGGSGAEVTLKALAKEENDYEVVLKNAKTTDDYYEAAEAVANGYINKGGRRYKVAGMIYPIRPGFISQEIIEDFGPKLAIGQVKDSELLDAVDGFGDSVYSECEVPGEMSQGLKTLSWGSTLSTVCMKARILMDVSTFPKAEQRKIKRVLIKASNQLN